MPRPACCCVGWTAWAEKLPGITSPSASRVLHEHEPARAQLLLSSTFRRIPRVALACPVCFGQNDSPLANAMNMGILAMLAVVVVVLACFATFFIPASLGTLEGAMLLARTYGDGDSARFNATAARLIAEFTPERGRSQRRR